MRRVLIRTAPAVLLASLAMMSTLFAQRPANAPATAPAGKAPDTVFLEDLTWAEVRDLVKAGTTTVIIGTAGTEQKGPHMVDGEHKFVMEYAADKIARALGKTLVAPVVTYVPEGSWENPGGHMAQAGHDHAARRSVRRAAGERRPQPEGRRLQDHPVPRRVRRQPQRHADGRRQAERAVEGQRREARSGSTTTTRSPTPIRTSTSPKSSASPPTRSAATRTSSTPPRCCSSTRSTSAGTTRAGGGYENSGVSGDNQSKSTPELGKVFLQIKIDNALAQIKELMAGTSTRQASVVPGEAAGGGRGGGRGGTRRCAGRAAEARADDGYGARRQDADRGARHGVHRRADVGRDARRDQGRQDHRDRPDRRHREERVPHGARQTQLRRHLRRQPDGAPAEERAGRADDSVRARRRSGYVGAGRDLAAVAGLRPCCSTRRRAA